MDFTSSGILWLLHFPRFSSTPTRQMNAVHSIKLHSATRQSISSSVFSSTLEIREAVKRTRWLGEGFITFEWLVLKVYGKALLVRFFAREECFRRSFFMACFRCLREEGTHEGIMKNHIWGESLHAWLLKMSIFLATLFQRSHEYRGVMIVYKVFLHTIWPQSIRVCQLICLLLFTLVSLAFDRLPFYWIVARTGACVLLLLVACFACFCLNLRAVDTHEKYKDARMGLLQSEEVANRCKTSGSMWRAY